MFTNSIYKNLFMYYTYLTGLCIHTWKERCLPCIIQSAQSRKKMEINCLNPCNNSFLALCTWLFSLVYMLVQTVVHRNWPEKIALTSSSLEPYYYKSLLYKEEVMQVGGGWRCSSVGRALPKHAWVTAIESRWRGVSP